LKNWGEIKSPFLFYTLPHTTMKKTQAQLKAEYLTELENTSTWRDSKHMQEYIYKKTAFLVELHD